LEEESDVVSLSKDVGNSEKPMEKVQWKEREEISLSSAAGSTYSRGESSQVIECAMMQRCLKC